MPNARTDPFPRYQFLVEIEGIVRAGFMTVSGLEEETEVREYREGTDQTSVRKLAGLNSYSLIVFEMGSTSEQGGTGRRPVVCNMRATESGSGNRGCRSVDTGAVCGRDDKLRAPGSIPAASTFSGLATFAPGCQSAGDANESRFAPIEAQSGHSRLRSPT